MINFALQRDKIRETKAELERTTNPRRRNDLKKYLTRLNREMAEAKKWQRGEIGGKRIES